MFDAMGTNFWVGSTEITNTNFRKPPNCHNNYGGVRKIGTMTLHQKKMDATDALRPILVRRKTQMPTFRKPHKLPQQL